MAHVMKNVNVKCILFRLQKYRCLSSYVERSSVDPCTLSTTTDDGHTQESSSFSKMFHINALITRFYRRTHHTPAEALDIGLPVEDHVYVGYQYLHWGNIDTYRTNGVKTSPINEVNFSVLSNFHNFTPCDGTLSDLSSLNTNSSSQSQQVEISDWLTDADQFPLNECSSFYGKTTENLRSDNHQHKPRELIDDTHFDGTNIDSINQDDIILRDVEDYKVHVDKSILDSTGEEGHDHLPSHFLKSSIQRVDPHDLDSILQSDLHLHNQVKTVTEMPEDSNFLQFSALSSKHFSDKKESGPPRPSREQIHKAKDALLAELPRFFHQTTKIQLFHPDVILENNYFRKPKISYGLGKYVWAMTKYRFLMNLRYSSLSVNLLNVSMHEDEGTIKVRWQVLGLSQLKAFMFWKFLPHNYRKNRGDMSDRHDGISTFTVGPDGLFHKHRVDRVITDDEYSVAKKTVLAPAAAMSFLAIVSGISGISDFY